MNRSTRDPAAASVAPALDAQVLDAQVLDALRGLDPGGAAGLLRRVFEAYLASLRELLGRLDDAQRRGDAQAMRLAVHTLKSSSASVGALALARQCADTESALREGPVDAAAALAGGVRAEAARVHDELRRVLAAPTLS